MIKAISFFVVGLVLGGLFMNAKFEQRAEISNTAEVIYGTRIGVGGQLVVLTSN